MPFGGNAFGWPYFGQGFAGSGNEVDVPFLASHTALYDITLVGTVNVPFLASHTTLYGIQIPTVALPFLASQTVLYPLFSVFSDFFRLAPGNGGEIFDVQLAPNGTSVTGPLVNTITSSDSTLRLTGSSFPTSGGFCVTIGSEVMYLKWLSGDSYRIVKRALSNTVAAAHTSGATATWSDHYDMAIVSTNIIAASFTANITSTGSTTYPGWLICFDSTQAYIGSSRYPMHVTSVLGVFDSGAGSSGSNRCDAAQPNAICTPTGISDDCPAALSNPSRIQSTIAVGDVALVRYTNPEASTMILASRSAALQSWFGLKRVDDTDHDVSLTDPNGHVVDTNPASGSYTGSVNDEWLSPLEYGINPSTGAVTDRQVAYTSVTLPGSDRFFTYGPPHYNEQGWPICCLAVRQGTRRVPYWASWDWRDYNYVYTGWATDATYAQLLVNRNGIIFGSVPEVDLPGPQDIDGPDAMWDDGSYHFGASWYVAIYSTPYLVVGPSIGGSGSPSGSGGTSTGFVPGVSFGGGAGSPVVIVPTVEGGSGGGITPPTLSRFDAKLL